MDIANVTQPSPDCSCSGASCSSPVAVIGGDSDRPWKSQKLHHDLNGSANETVMLQRLFQITDLAHLVFNFCALQDLGSFVRTCLHHSSLHFTYRFAKHQSIDFEKFLAVLEELQAQIDPDTEDDEDSASTNHVVAGDGAVSESSGDECLLGMRKTRLTALLKLRITTVHGVLSTRGRGFFGSNVIYQRIRCESRCSQYFAQFHLRAFPSITSLTFHDWFDEPILPGELHEGLREIHFGRAFNEPILPAVIPSTVTAIQWSDCFNQPIVPDSLPHSLQTLSFGPHMLFNHPLSSANLPDSLTTFNMSSNFRHSLSDVLAALPSRLKELHLHNHLKFQQQDFRLLPSMIPSQLRSLSFPPDFNEPNYASFISPSVEYLRFGLHFQQPLTPLFQFSNLSELVLCDDFNLPVDANVLPSSLLAITFGFRFNQIIGAGVLPKSLQSLRFGREFNQILTVDNLPSSLRNLQFGELFNQPIAESVLPASLRGLIFGANFDQALAGNLPSGLCELYLGRAYSHELGVLPRIMERLEFRPYDESLYENPMRFNRPITEGQLSPTLRELHLSRGFNQPIAAGVLPPSLQILIFPNACKFNQMLAPGVLPPCLLKLQLGDAFNQPLLHGSLPPSLTHLQLSGAFNHPLQDSHVSFLPQSLRILHFAVPAAFNQVLFPHTFPSKLENLQLSGNWGRRVGSLLGVFPNSLRHLSFNGTFFGFDGGQFESKCLPARLVCLELSNVFRCPLILEQLPHSLRTLSVPRNYQFLSTIIEQLRTRSLITIVVRNFITSSALPWTF